MATNTCQRHRRWNCRDAYCAEQRRIAGASLNRTDDTTDPASLTNPVSPLHQAVYGGAYYGSTDTSDSGSSSSSDSGSSSSSYDSGSSSSSCDSGGGW